MKKRLLSIALILTLIYTSIPVAFATENSASETEYTDFRCGTSQETNDRFHSALLEKNSDDIVVGAMSSLMARGGIIEKKEIGIMPSVGNPRILVLPISFPDYPQYLANYDEEELQEHLFGEHDPTKQAAEQSVRGFYYHNSYGKLDITGDILPVYNAPNTSDTYVKFADLGELITAAIIEQIETNVLDLSEYDTDKDGHLDSLIIKILRPEAPRSGSIWWPNVMGWAGPTFNSTQISQLMTTSIDTILPIDYHETGHLLGLPDNYGGNNNPISSLMNELMQDGRIIQKCMINVYYKYILGWFDENEYVICSNANAGELKDYELLTNDYYEDGVSGLRTIIIIPDEDELPYAEAFFIEHRIRNRKYATSTLHNGVYAWHINSYLNSNKTGYMHSTNYIQPVKRKGDGNSSGDYQFDMGHSMSPTSTPYNTNFYNDVYTGAHFQAVNIDLFGETATVSAGIKDPDLRPAPVITIEGPSKKAVKRGVYVDYTISVTLDGEYVDMTGTFFPSPKEVETGGALGLGVIWGTEKGKNPQKYKVKGSVSDGDGTIYLNYPAGTFIIDGKRSREVTSDFFYVDSTQPEIELKGATTQYIEKGDAYTELGAEITDNLDPDILGKLQIDATGVNTNKIGTYTVTYSGVDHAENAATPVTRMVVVQDTVAPTATVSYSTENPTNDDVVATITPSEAVTGELTHTFTENGSYTFTFIDEAGNTGTATAEVTWIDKSKPTGTVSYDIDSLTNQDVTATISVAEGTTVTGGNTHIFEDNGSHDFVLTNSLGTKNTVTARVDWIDKAPPTASVTYSTTAPTNQDVIATVTFSEEVNITSNAARFTKTGDKTYTVTFTENEASLAFAFVDMVGNMGSSTLTVNNIDKSLPTGTVSYSPSVLTNGDVVATLDVAVGIAVLNNEGKKTYTFKQDGSFDFKIKNEAGTEGTVTATVNWIDKDKPTVNVTYSTTTPTNQNVTATVTFSEKVEITSNQSRFTQLGTSNSYTVTFVANETWSFGFKDMAGNTNSSSVSVANIDTTPPTATISYSPSTWTNGNVAATLVPGESVTVTNHTSHTYNFSNEGTSTFTFQFVDAAGNTGSATATVDWIDKTAPTATVSYSTTDPTNKNVTATITPSEQVTIESEGGASHIFTDNGSFTFRFKDRAGNTGSLTATVANIDRKAPTATVDYDFKTLTNQDVTANLVPSEKIIVTNNAEKMDYTFSKNGTFTFEFRDEAGNTGTAIAKVDWIDKVAPTATIEYTTTEWTAENVTATLKPDKKVYIIDEGGSFTHTFTENGSYTFEFEDEAGNTGTATATVGNIDKSRPTGTVTYDLPTLTNKDVTATITVAEGITVIGDATHKFEANGKHDFTVKNQAGTAAVVTATVDWIDKEAPMATVEYSTTELTNGSVYAEITPSKKVTITSDGGDRHLFEENGSFTFEFIDAAGNTGTATATVDWIDTTAPTATVIYSTTDPTNENVTATIEFSEEVNILTNSDKLTTTANPLIYTSTFTTNDAFTIKYTDLANNEGDDLPLSVQNIDKTAPTATISYTPDDTGTKVEGPVVATLVPDKDITVTNNGDKLTYTFTQNGTFTFSFKDKAGNTNTAKAEVSWIEQKQEGGNVPPPPPPPPPAETIIVTFDYQGATGGNDEKTRELEAGMAIGSLPAPTKFGNDFVGWFTQANGKGDRVADDFIPTANTTIYASWKLKSVEGASKHLTDVDRGKWYVGAVDFVVANKLFAGMNDTEFKPAEGMNRAMFVTVVGRLAEQLGEKTTGYTSSFDDVTSGSYYEKYVAWASAKGIIKGQNDKTFGTMANVSRQDMAVILIRFADYMNIDLKQNTGKKFTDESEMSTYAKDAIKEASQAGIINGYKDGSFNPKGTSTRAEVAQVFVNFVG